MEPWRTQRLKNEPIHQNEKSVLIHICIKVKSGIWIPINWISVGQKYRSNLLAKTRFYPCFRPPWLFPFNLKPFLSHLVNVFSYTTVFNSFYIQKKKVMLLSRLNLLKKLEGRHCKGGKRNARGRTLKACAISSLLPGGQILGCRDSKMALEIYLQSKKSAAQKVAQFQTS